MGTKSQTISKKRSRKLVYLHLYLDKGKRFFKTPALVAQRLKHLPPIWETRVQSLGREDTLEKEMVTHSSILAWRILWMEEPGRLQSMGLERVGHDRVTSLYFTTIVAEYSQAGNTSDRVDTSPLGGINPQWILRVLFDIALKMI